MLLDSPAETVPPLPGARPWQLPGWRGEVLAWTETQLGQPATELTWVHATDVGAVLTARVGDLQVYLKVGEDGREARAAMQFATQLPGLTPELLAADPQRGWLLTRGAGSNLLGSSELQHWEQAVRNLACLHRTVRFEGLSVHPFGALPELAGRLLAPEALSRWGLTDEQQTQVRQLLPRMLGIHRAVSDLGLLDCACHGDFHANNALVQGDEVRLFDVSEACTAHPFTDIGWFLAFIMLPTRADLPLRQQHPELGERLWAVYLTETGLHTTLPWQDVALLALFHRAVVYDARFRDWQGTLPKFRPQYVPYYLKLTRHFASPV